MSDRSLVSVASQPQRTQAGGSGRPERPSDLIKEGSLRLGSSTGALHADRGASPRHLRGGLPSGSPPAPSGGADGRVARQYVRPGRGLACETVGDPQAALEEEAQGASPEILARMAVAIRGADVVIAGSLSDEDRGIRGLVPHLADLSSNAYRRPAPPAPLIGHAGFAQVAKKFQYVQMSHEEARRLAAGASDLGVLTQVLRKRLGEGGEFAITYFGGHGVLWADNKEWEIEPIAEDDADKPAVADAFCTAWVAARRFSNVGVPQALAAARKAAAKALAASRPLRRDGSA